MTVAADRFRTTEKFKPSMLVDDTLNKGDPFSASGNKSNSVSLNYPTPDIENDTMILGVREKSNHNSSTSYHHQKKMMSNTSSAQNILIHQTISPEDSDASDEEMGLLRIRSLLKNRTGNKHMISTSRPEALNYRPYKSEFPHVNCHETFLNSCQTDEERSHIESRFFKWKKWLSYEKATVIQNDWPLLHTRMDADTRYSCMLFLKKFAVNGAVPRESISRAMTYFDIFMSTNKSLDGPIQAHAVVAAILSLIIKMEGLPFMTQEVVHCVMKQLSDVLDIKFFRNMERDLLRSMSAIRLRFLSTMKMDLCYPTPCDWLNLYFDNAKSLCPEHFGKIGSRPNVAAINSIPVYHVLENAYMDIIALSLPASCLVASVFFAFFGSMLSHEQFKLITGYERRQASHTMAYLEAVKLRIAALPFIEGSEEVIEPQGMRT